MLTLKIKETKQYLVFLYSKKIKKKKICKVYEEGVV